ncbi:hypothetical protein F5050DRAFT_373455 [Lentinula boryana]|uniref:C2H2-type domain-containing protein n=1 Tax=Lentinula boryana TaxID=40481 RepID=A0ABQ8Q990_9AGAR|nr:hypothetical protein F5050DRAFT_373455 [Lentinula boryana]
MPRAKSLKDGRPNEANMAATCSKFMHRCPYAECNFENLQKSNVETHIRTHTKSKTNNCPDCDFTTVDPGSLTRHRKRIHGYIPKTRRSRHPKPTSTATGSPIATSEDPSSHIHDTDEETSSMNLQTQNPEFMIGPLHAQSQPEPPTSNELLMRTNFNQAPISRFITTLSSSTSISAPVPTTLKRVSRAQIEDEEGEVRMEFADKDGTSQSLNGFWKSSLGPRQTPPAEGKQVDVEEESSLTNKVTDQPVDCRIGSEDKNKPSGLVPTLEYGTRPRPEIER